MRLELLAVDHAGDDHGQTVKKQLGRRFAGKIDAYRFFVRRAHQLVDIIGIIANALEVGCGRLVHLQQPAERIDDVCRGYRIARGEIGLAKMEGDALVIYLPALGKLR